YKTSCDYLSYGSVGITVYKNHILVWCSWYHGSEKMIKLSNNTEHNLKIWLENLIPNVEIKTQYENNKS
ncbi:MAG: hypothetical protein K2M17_02310, partial [Bacilli bacterium]|nr:hypothetical protein [Bacilli bacterium]